MLNKKGFTLVEIMISLFLVLVICLGLTQTAMVGIDTNMTNMLREEGISVAQASMHQARDMGYANLIPGATALPPVSRSFRSLQNNIDYNITRTVTNWTTDSRQVNIAVDWQWKGQPFNYVTKTIVRNPS